MFLVYSSHFFILISFSHKLFKTQIYISNCLLHVRYYSLLRYFKCVWKDSVGPLFEIALFFSFSKPSGTSLSYREFSFQITQLGVWVTPTHHSS